MLRGIKRQQNLTDRSLLWLKELYIQLYFENNSQPLVADAIKVSQYLFSLTFINDIISRRSYSDSYILSKICQLISTNPKS